MDPFLRLLLFARDGANSRIKKGYADKLFLILQSSYRIRIMACLLYTSWPSVIIRANLSEKGGSLKNDYQRMMRPQKLIHNVQPRIPVRGMLFVCSRSFRSVIYRAVAKRGGVWTCAGPDAFYL